MSAYKFFRFAFAAAGDVSPVPDGTQPGGTVSYESGWGNFYQLQLGMDPSALPIPRDQSNQLMYDVTLALQQYQEWGTPNFITSAQNNSVAFPYSKYAFAQYDDGTNGIRLFQSKVDSNSSLPTNFSTWRWLDNSAGKIIFDDSITFEGTVADGDVVYYDAGNSWFAKAVANATVAQNVIGVADVTFKRIFGFGVCGLFSGLTAGSAYYLSTATPGAVTSTIPGDNIVPLGFAFTTTTMFLQPEPGAGKAADNALPVGTILDFAGTSVPAGFLACNTAVPVSRTTYANLFAAIGILWGAGDGSTTFNLPDFSRRTAVGSGGTGTGTLGNATGNIGGSETHTLTIGEMPSHDHAGSTVEYGPDGANAVCVGRGDPHNQDFPLSIVPEGGGSAHNIMQPSAIVTKIIKY